jgi:hypothetical protein
MGQTKNLKPQLILGAASMASGLALVVSIFTEASLAITLICLGSFAGFLITAKWLRSSQQERKTIASRAITGLAAGAIATLAYDLSRLLFVNLLNIQFNPFGAFPHFGKLLVGVNSPQYLILISGILYHLLNGILFAIAYCFLFSNRNWKWGIVWAMALEFAMFTIYPTWLDLQAVMKEFTIVSVSGHIAYGTTLGLLCSKWLKNR